MFNNSINFLNLIKTKMIRKSVQPTDLIYYGEKDQKYNGGFKPVAIEAKDFKASMVGPQGAVGQQGPIGPQGVAGPVGPAGLEWQGAWVSGASYVQDDAVGYNGASWFCINPTTSAVAPNLNTGDWALLASQGSPGPMGPQGIAGPAGPSGSGLVGNVYGQTTFWNHASAQWMPTFGLSTNPSTGNLGAARVAIGAPVLNTSGYALRLYTNNAGMRMDQVTGGFGLNNWMATPQTSFQYGLNGNTADPVSNNAVFFTSYNNYTMKFATNFGAPGGGDRLLIQGNGQVVIGSALATNPEARFVVKQKDLELEDFGRGVILASPNGTRYRITVNDAGTIVSTAV